MVVKIDRARWSVRIVDYTNNPTSHIAPLHNHILGLFKAYTHPEEVMRYVLNVLTSRVIK